MRRERYPGEQRGLGSFVSELLPLVERELGPDSLLLHAVRRALCTGDLADLRRARQMFNLLPRERKRALSAGIVARSRSRSTAARPQPDRGSLLESYSRREPASFVCFEARESIGRPTPPAVGIRHELLDDASLRVLVRPGTLPSAVADRLRRIADLIEKDRRLLSERFWRGAPCADSGDDASAPPDRADAGT